MIGSLYRPGSSALHGLSAGAKLCLLFAAGIGIFVVDRPIVIALTLAAAVGLVASTGVDRATVRHDLGGALVIIGLFWAVNLLFVEPIQAGVAALRLVTLVLLAYAVTITTRTADMIEALEHALAPLDRIGLVNAERVALAIGLAIRFVPVIAGAAEDIREAQAARGLAGNPLALIVPLVIRVLKAADELAEAIDARSFPPKNRVDDPNSNRQGRSNP